jgi:hypothetical protein
MNVNVFTVKEISDEHILELIKNAESFTLTEVADMSRTVLKLEEIIKNQGLTCRIFTPAKFALCAGSFFPPLLGVTALFGAVSLVHLAATANPNYNIEKNYFKKSIDINRVTK